VKKGSKSLSKTAWSMPQPVSVRESSTYFPGTKLEKLY